MRRDELCEMIRLAEQLASVGEPIVLATLFSANGSTYRPLGSMMVSGPGSAYIAGGVSGGCLEEYIARRGRELIANYAATMLSFDTDPNSNGDGVPSLGCGGSIEVLIERFSPEHLAFLGRLRDAHAADECSTVACVIDPAELPSLSVARVWLEDAGHAAVDLELTMLREHAVAEGRSKHGEVADSRRALVHYVPPLTRLVLLGAGNDAVPLANLARSLGWHVTIADRRARLATRTRFPDVDQVIAANWWEALHQTTFTPDTAVVLMTHSVEDDVEIVSLLADKPVRYVGVLGPEHRLGWVVQGAQELATLSDEFLACVRGPIGLDLGERSPEGIAVSIVSEILANKNGRAALPLSQAVSRSRWGALRKAIAQHV